MNVYAGFYKSFEECKEPDSDLLESLESLSLVCTAKPSSDLAVEYILNDLDKCPECSMKYKRIGDLKNHMKNQHGISETLMFYQCVCGSRYSDKKQLTRHCKNHDH